MISHIGGELISLTPQILCIVLICLEKQLKDRARIQYPTECLTHKRKLWYTHTSLGECSDWDNPASPLTPDTPPTTPYTIKLANSGFGKLPTNSGTSAEIRLTAVSKGQAYIYIYIYIFELLLIIFSWHDVCINVYHH